MSKIKIKAKVEILEKSEVKEKGQKGKLKVVSRVVHKSKICSNNFSAQLICCSLG